MQGNISTDATKCEKSISKLYESEHYKKIETVFPFDLIEKQPKEYQAHLERIADYLNIEGVWRETEIGVQFHDLSETWTKQVHHFRSTSLKEETDFVKESWNKILYTPNKIPSLKLFIENGDGTSTIPLESLKYRSVVKPSPPKPVLSFSQKSNSNIQLNSNHPTITSTPISTKLHRLSPILNASQIVSNSDGTDDFIQQSEFNASQSSFGEVISAMNSNQLTKSQELVESDDITIANENKSDDENEIDIQTINLAPLQKFTKIKENAETDSIASKTGKILQKIFGNIDEVRAYDKLRTSYKKKHSTTILPDLQKAQSVLEVKLSNVYEEEKKRLKTLEMEAIEESSDMEVVPKNEGKKKQYHQSMKIIKLIRLLQNEFSIISI